MTIAPVTSTPDSMPGPRIPRLIPVPTALPRQCALPVARPVRPIQVAVTAQGGADVVRWAAALDAEPVVMGAVPANGEEADQWSAVVADIARYLVETADSTRTVEFHTPHASLGIAARELGFEVHSLSRSHARLSELRSATAPPPEPDSRTRQTSRRVLVAVDGSWGHGSRHGAWAFLDDAGCHGAAAAPAIRDILLAELNAIRLALGAYPSCRALTIRSDSRRALALVAGRTNPSAAHYGVLVRIRTLLVGRDVEFEWTRGHVGPGLHDGADRLAVQARRNREAGLGQPQTQATTRRIVEESLRAHRAAGATAPRPPAAHATSAHVVEDVRSGAAERRVASPRAWALAS